MKHHKDAKHVVIVGAGPGGLVAGMLLAHAGHKVTLYEKNATVGGRNARLTVGDYHFDTGPTFLLMKYVLDQVFTAVGRKSADYLKFTRLDPMYRLFFGDRVMNIYDDSTKMQAEIDDKFPGNPGSVERFMTAEKRRFDNLLPVLEEKSDSIADLLSERFILALPYMYTPRSLYEQLGQYFKEEELRLCFTFQAKYLGMSPWECPGAFTMIPFAEHYFGIEHVEGGLCQISNAMAKVIEEDGGEIQLNTPVQEIVVKNGVAIGVKLDSGQVVTADEVIVNADFGYAASKLFKPHTLPAFTKEKLAKKQFSCSTFIMYLGLDTTYEQLSHHSIYFAKDYRGNVNDIFAGKVDPTDVSFYLQNAVVTDKTLAPKGHSTFYILVPTANNLAEYDWAAKKGEFRRELLRQFKERTGITDLEEHIVEEKITTPQDWELDYNVFLGAIFGFAHNLNQMLLLRPHNRLQGVKNCYLVGASTHPGSGLPTIYQSAIISAGLIHGHNLVDQTR